LARLLFQISGEIFVEILFILLPLLLIGGLFGLFDGSSSDPVEDPMLEDPELEPDPETDPTLLEPVTTPVEPVTTPTEPGPPPPVMDLVGNSLDNVITGTDAADFILGRGGNDVLDGGAGNDTINDGTDEDTLIGGTGDDLLEGRDGSDSLDGGEGDDTLIGNFGFDTLNGGTGNDSINGERGQDMLSGGAGDDFIEGQSSDDTLLGGDGADTLLGGSGRDFLSGGTGSDSLDGGNGDDTIIGGGSNFFRTTSGAGNWTAEMEAALDELVLTDAALATGGPIADIFASAPFAGVDVSGFAMPPVADTAADFLSGGSGNDALFLETGDVGVGGIGDDTFHLNGDAAPDRIMTITDFAAADDMIVVEHDASLPAPVVSVADNGGNADVLIDGVRLASVRGAAGILTAADVTLASVDRSIA
jgi:Ca2+-binding RTX toxin-like protein